jgi:hypothetical protein
MSVPVLGPMTFAGFAHGWYFGFLLVVLGLVGLYVLVQVTRQRRTETARPVAASVGGPAGRRAARADRRDGRTDH